MKLSWSPETAEKAYLDTVKQVGMATKSSSAEFLSALAGGWKAKLIVEAWSGGATTSSIGLAIAAHHSGGRHVCILPDERSRQDYLSSMHIPRGISLPEVIVGDSELLLERLVGIDFLVVDGQRKDAVKIFSLAKLSHLGGVLVCKNTNQQTFSRFRWNRALGSASSVVRSLILPNGLDIAYVAAASSREAARSLKGSSCWITHIDHESGEEHVYRR